MNKFDWFNILSAAIILFFSISYFRSDELSRAYTTLGLSIILGVPVIYRVIKKRMK